jgi:H+/Cl- antiporter ClcA
MKIPLAGPIFALEMTSRHSSLTSSAVRSMSTAVLSSLAGIAFVRGVLMPDIGVGGHFDYISRAAVGVVSGREMIAVGLGCGVGGALVGTIFHITIRFLNRLFWSKKKEATLKDTHDRDKYIGILKKVCVALVIGILSTQYPQTMFWGEGSLQCMIDGQCTPLAATPHGLPVAMMQWAKVNPNNPLISWYAATQVGLAKFLAIALASAAKFPGGVIFPLLSNGAGISHSILQGLGKIWPGLSNSLVSPMLVMSFMAAMLTSITRTPMATCLILAMTASGITPLSVLLPGALLASYVSVFVSGKLSKESFFEYSS